MTSKYQIIDNALGMSDYLNLKNIVLSPMFSWYYQNSVAYGKIDRGEDYEEETFYLTHTFYNEDAPKSDYFNFIKPVLNFLKVNCLYRVKANLYPNQNKFIKHPLHIDTKFEHKGALLYLNTNNGKTILKDGTEIDSIDNRILLFNSFEEHCSTNCTDEKIRLNINFNYF
jgi:hypothetical protein